MSASKAQLDVLVLGDHPCAWLASALLKQEKIYSQHATIPGDVEPDRLVMVNPDLFTLNKLLGEFGEKVAFSTAFGLRFLSHEPGISNEHRSKSATICVARYSQVREAMRQIALDAGVATISPLKIQIKGLDEAGVKVEIDGQPLHPRVLFLAGRIAPSQQKMLGMPESWGSDVVHRYTFGLFQSPIGAESNPKPLVPICLELKDGACWAWMLRHGELVQLSVHQPLESVADLPADELLARWEKLLRQHGCLLAAATMDNAQSGSMDLPLAGALAHEGVANRTLLIGPAGGFYSACAEDIYPNCWSAIFAVDVVKKALRERHVQDALQPYRQKWRTTLGDYMRGPQQNLKFLLPLVYRNQAMASRLAESILHGKSIVR